MTQPQFDRVTEYLISNGDVPAVTSQQIYEYAWSQGIRPLRECALKPKTYGQRPKPRHRRPSCTHHGGSRRARVWTAIMDAQQAFGSDIMSDNESNNTERWNEGLF